jgi:hypothetical protein
MAAACTTTGPLASDLRIDSQSTERFIHSMARRRQVELIRIKRELPPSERLKAPLPPRVTFRCATIDGE